MSIASSFRGVLGLFGDELDMILDMNFSSIGYLFSDARLVNVVSALEYKKLW
jgi:hypothetical protein